MDDYNDKLEDFYKKIYDDLEHKTLGDDFGSYLYTRINSGTQKAYNKSHVETRTFNMDFLNVIESTYPALLKIMKDPKKSIRYEQEVVSVEKAKRVNADTVRHLSSHTHLIKEIKDNGDVVPAKVLSTYSEEELGIYENRFIKSLIKRIEMFLERRYEVMKDSLDSFEAQHLNVENNFLMSGKDVSIKVDIYMKEVVTEEKSTKKTDFERLLYVRELVQGLKGMDFMRALAKAKDVFPPIMKTNILLHNPDFQMCYNLWIYLDKTDGIAFDINAKEKNYRYPILLEKDMNEAMTLMLAAFLHSREISGIVPSTRNLRLRAPKTKMNKEITEPFYMEPDRQKIEDYRMNEYLLSKTAHYYESSFKGLKRSGSTENESLRVVYKQMLEMMDQIYPKVFNVVLDDIDKSDLYKRLEYARKKQNVLKIVQKQKQMNIARMGKSIKKCDRDIESLERRIKQKENKAHALELKRKEKEAKALKNKDIHSEYREREKAKIKKILEEQKSNEKK